ncbi:hypothetical protein DFJ77DRAFT_358779 [Powellomyces hirtus]|nr:hypothetical protein DFJ77DRAFT_358779 [Powellomyces hirtus]
MTQRALFRTKFALRSSLFCEVSLRLPTSDTGRTMNGSEFRFHSATPPRRFDGSNQLSSGFPTFSFEQLSDSRFTSSSSGLTPSAQHTGGPGRSDFDFLRTENEISAASPGGLIGALDLDCDEEHAIEAPPRKFAIPVATADEDVFGFGDFGQVFVTEEDLDKAREKLSEDEVITPEQTVEHMLNVLQQWVTEQQTNDSPHDTSAFANVAICYNFNWDKEK